MQPTDIADRLLFNELDRWHRWQQSQVPMLRRVRVATARKSRNPRLMLAAAIWGDPTQDSVAVALESTSPSQIPALIEPARHLIAKGVTVRIITHAATSSEITSLVGTEPTSVTSLEAGPPYEWRLRAILSAGDHMSVGHTALRWAHDMGLPYVVVQHGILTPFTPPLPEGCHLLAWSANDFKYWRNGHRHEGTVVGSQLLWNAQQQPPSVTSGPGEVTFLGQLHGAELPRKATRTTVAALRNQSRVHYRPHPGERDISSKIQHSIWQKQGLQIEYDRTLASARGDVLSLFSTGLLESAGMGMSAFGYSTSPPRWLQELWQRYEIAVWGESQATQPQITTSEPARISASYLLGLVT